MALITGLAIAGTAATVASAGTQASGGKKGGLTGTQRDLLRHERDQFERYEATRNPLIEAIFGGQLEPEDTQTPSFTRAFPQSDLGQFLKGAYQPPAALDPFREAALLRAGTLPRVTNTGDALLPLPLRAPFQLYNEDLALQGQAAREDLRRTVGARGGQLTALLAENRLAEAMERANIPLREVPVRQQLYGTLLGAALGGTPGSTAGSQAQLQQQQQQAQQAQAGKDTLGTLGGLALSLGKNGGLGGAGTGTGSVGTTVNGLPWLGTGTNAIP